MYTLKLDDIMVTPINMSHGSKACGDCVLHSCKLDQHGQSLHRKNSDDVNRKGKKKGKRRKEGSGLDPATVATNATIRKPMLKVGAFQTYVKYA